MMRFVLVAAHQQYGKKVVWSLHLGMYFEFSVGDDYIAI